MPNAVSKPNPHANVYCNSSMCDHANAARWIGLQLDLLMPSTDALPWFESQSFRFAVAQQETAIWAADGRIGKTLAERDCLLHDSVLAQHRCPYQPHPSSRPVQASSQWASPILLFYYFWFYYSFFCLASCCPVAWRLGFWHCFVDIDEAIPPL